MISYQEAIRQIEKLEFFGIKLGLKNTKALLALLGNPERKCKIIHIGGTNGKGSVSAMCQAAIIAAGHKTGMYTSPHLQSFRERIQINGRFISKKELADIYKQVKKAANILKKRKIQATYFEFTTAMAFLYFAQKKCEYAVIEVGMGGRLDSTNVVKPEVAVITNISLEHKQYLGKTKEKIAYEKAGIIKQGIHVYTAERDKKVLDVFRAACRSRNATMHVIRQKYDGKMSLKGEHQKLNAALARAALSRIGLEDKFIRKGIESAKWPGRLEEIQYGVFLDGAHNPAGAKVLARHFKGNKVVLVLGISADKDMEKIVETLIPISRKVILTCAKYRAASVDELERHVKSAYTKEPDVKKAVRLALREKGIKLITGSLFLVGEARGLWKKID